MTCIRSNGIRQPRSVKAINKAINVEPKKVQANTNAHDNFRFFIKGDKKYHQIKSEDILFIEAYGNYSKLYFKEKCIISHDNISYYNDFLPASHFLRVHKSFIVALNKIELVRSRLILL